MDNSNIENLKLPQAVVSRLIKEALPAGISVSKEVKVWECDPTKQALMLCTHIDCLDYANESAKEHKRKNITAADVLSAVKILECEELERPIMDALQLFKAQKSQRLEQRKRRQTGDESAPTTQSTPSKTSKRTIAADASTSGQQGEPSNREAGGNAEARSYEEVDEESEHGALNSVDDGMDSQRPFL